MPVNIGGWELGFNSFDMTFKQNVIIESNISGRIKIPKLKDGSGNDAEVIITGHLNEQGDFNLTASESDGFQPIEISGVLDIYIQSVELGKENDKFYIGTSCEIEFTNPIIKKLFCNNSPKISIPRIRFYENGKWEIVGGGSFIPTNISLCLGPIDMTVSNIHKGSYQGEYRGVQRQYEYWGFDGAISIDPLGIDARGEGIKYYYTVDNDEYNDDGDSFLRIQTIEVDLIIPGTASPESAIAIIHGMVSIPEPGESPEYVGEVSLKLPKAKIAGGAAMRLQPRHPAFLVDAYVDLPAPIPIGPLGIYGFRGLLGFRYVAEKEAVGLVSGQDTWYDYYTYPPKGIHHSKFSGPERTADYDFPFSIGAGAVLGTSFDSGTSLSVRAMLLLSLPTLFLVEGKASILSARLGLDDNREPPFFAFVAWGDNSIEMGLGADFQLPQDNGWIMKLYAEVQAGFFFNGQRNWYINFGTKDVPIKGELLKIGSSYLITAQTYLMLSASGIEAGARVEFDLKKRFGPAKVHIYAYLELGGFISFEKPQLGAYIALGGMIDVDIWIVGLTLKLDLLLAVEAAKPFLIYGELRLKVCIRIIWKICASFKVSIKWETNKHIDRDPIPALPAQGHSDSQYYSSRTKELVKGVHMLTNQTFDLSHENDWVIAVPDESTVSTVPFSHTEIDKILPLDTYIDIKTVKGLIPNAISAKIGGHTGGAENYTDLIPPNRTVRGGREIRQVKHKYSIEDIEIKAWLGGNNWIDYHPFEAIVKPEDRTQVNHLRVGYWQRSGNQYNAIRLLAVDPVSYTESGEPGWMIPEQYGITPSELFCESTRRNFDCVNVLNKSVGTIYTPPNGYIAHNINGAYFTLEGQFEPIATSNPDGTQDVLISEDNFRVVENNPPINFIDSNNIEHNFSKSLEFDNGNSLVIILPEPSVEVKLKLTASGEGVTIMYYKSIGIENYNTVYELIDQEYKTKNELEEEIKFSKEGTLISKVVITPKRHTNQEIQEIEQEIQLLLENNYNSSTGSFSISPELEENLTVLRDRLRNLTYYGCGHGALKGGIGDMQIQAGSFDNRRFEIGKTPYKNINNCEDSFNVLFNKEKDYGISPSIEVEEQRFLVNSKEELENLFNTYQLEEIPEVNFSSKSILFISLKGEVNTSAYNLDVNNVCKLNNYYKVKLHKIYPDRPPIRENYIARFIVLEINKTANASIEFNTFDVYWNSANGILITSDLKERYCLIHKILNDNLNTCIESKEPSNDYYLYNDCFESFVNTMSTYDSYYNNFIKQLQPAYNNFIIYITQTKALLFFEKAYNLAKILLDQIKELGNCCCNEDSLNSIRSCSTSLQEICWMTLESHEFNLTIPGQDAVEQEQQDMVDAIQKMVQPIWRPNTKYYIRFRLKDDVDNGQNQGLYDYYYGFKTVGPVGHYHKHSSVDYIPEGANPDQYPLTSLRQYIDYNRSYPNADGNLLMAKPLFYGHNQCKITIYFSKPLAYHMVNKWYDYNGLPELAGNMHIAIKDPVTDDVIPYPLPVDYSKETVPTGQTFATWLEFDSNEELDSLSGFITVFNDGNEELAAFEVLKWEYLHVSNKYHLRINDDAEISKRTDIEDGKIVINVDGISMEFIIISFGKEDATWNVDNNPRIPMQIQWLNNMVDYINENSNAIDCELTIGEQIIPNSYAYNVTLTNLKPRKLYTALLYNAFDKNSNGNLQDTESEEVHQFVFQTSKYQNFEAQVKSYWLRELDTDGAMLNERQAVFEIPLSLSTAEINTAYNIVAGVSDTNSDVLELQYYHLFDRATEGVLGFNPIDPPENTEFNVLKDTNTGKVIGILIRNPEPFNIPKIPLDIIENTIAVVFAGPGNVNNTYYKVLYSKDYSQALIMHSSKEITDDALNFRFQYKTWNGSSYQVSDTVVIENIQLTQ